MKKPLPTIYTKTARMLARTSILLIATVFLAGCGSKLNGTYEGDSNAKFDRMTFKSNGKVDITDMGTTTECAYKVDGKSVKLIGFGGQSQVSLVFQVDKAGNLNGGEMIGKYYFVGGDPNRMYGIYAGTGDETVEFKPDGHLIITTSGNTILGSYTVAGKKLTITTEGSLSIPRQTIVLKIVNQNTLEDEHGRQLHKQGPAS